MTNDPDSIPTDTDESGERDGANQTDQEVTDATERTGGESPQSPEEVSDPDVDIQRSRELARRERHLQERELGLDKRAEDLDIRQQELDEREQELEALEEEMTDLRENLEQWQENLRQREEELNEREAELDAYEEELTERARELDEDEETLYRYWVDQVDDVEESIQETMWSALKSYQNNRSRGRFGRTGNLLVALTGLGLVAAGIGFGAWLEWGSVAGVFGTPFVDVGIAGVLIIVGIAINILSVTEWV